MLRTRIPGRMKARAPELFARISRRHSIGGLIMKGIQGFKSAAGFAALAALLSFGQGKAWANQVVQLKSPDAGAVFYAGQPIEISGKAVGDPSPSAQVV